MSKSEDTEPSSAIVNGNAPNGVSKDIDSQSSHISQTASDYIDSQLQLEADAREALPYAFDHCTQPLGPLKQNLFACLTCNPPPASPSGSFTPAAVCYSCSIACHGEHTLVELFNRRNFTCDCGTTRLPVTSPCTLRIDPATGMKGPVHSQVPAEGNTYNQNCQNRFCGCGEVYNAEEEKGTMYQCLGLAGESDGGCGEDWWHPECILGLGRDWAKDRQAARDKAIKENSEGGGLEVLDPLPPEFPEEDSFDTFICYKCVNANQWIKRYAGSTGFLPPVWNDTKLELGLKAAKRMEDEAKTRLVEYKDAQSKAIESCQRPTEATDTDKKGVVTDAPNSKSPTDGPSHSMKRKADDADLDNPSSSSPKRSKTTTPLYHNYLPQAPTESFSLFCKEDFRENFCRCPECYPLLQKHRQLLEEEESYEPPISESGDEGGESVGSKSLLDRGEAALSNVDRVRAIEGVMVYNHLKDKVKSFLQPFAESGQAVGAEDIKAYFEKLRGDEQGITAAAVAGAGDGGDNGGDNRKEQSGK
ncbi:E3 ubiquitin-protein ligase UBR7, partial [Lecanoromycetidae sp. Uapishka_2]